MLELRPIALSLAFLSLAGGASADVLFQDDFEDGIVDTSVYVAVGNAIVTESGGKLRVRTFGVGDGVEIAIPDGAQCVTLSQTVPQSELDRREGYGLAGVFEEASGEETVGVAVETRRPFWNRCQVTIKVGKDKQVVGFWGWNEKSLKRPCPALKDIRIDWLPPATEGGEDRIQVEVKQADGSYETVATRESTLSHAADDWKKLAVTQIAEQNPDDPEVPWTWPPKGLREQVAPATAGTAGMTIEIDDLVITDDHPNPPTAAVALTPSQVAPGTFVNDMLVQLKQPLFNDPGAVFTMGPGFLIENLTVLDPFTAMADVTVSSRAVPQGHGVKVETAHEIAAGCVDVASTEVFENARPTVDFQCPRNVRSGQPFEVTFAVNDTDHDLVTVEAVLERVEPEQILSETDYVAFEMPQTLTFDFPGLPAGEYAILGLADDGHLPNGGSLCDCTFQVAVAPVVVDLVKRAGGAASQRLTGLDAALRRVTITNGEKGFAAFDLVVNGKRFKMTRMAAREQRILDISTAMLGGLDNVLEITGYGSRRSRARVVISER